MRRQSIIGTLIATGALVGGLSPAQPAAAVGRPSWQDFATGSTASIRGLSAVSRDTAWAGGVGQVLRTVDGGRTWQQVAPPDTANLQFRDVEAFDGQHAVIMSAGDGPDSRIYVTSDGGAHWTETFRNGPAGFYDCMTFFDHRHGLALSDPVDGRFRVLSTDDGGMTWSVTPTAGMPDALPKEFAFAASGTCLVSTPGQDAWFATGGDAVARVFHTGDRGLTWDVVDTPVPSGETAGIYSLAFRDTHHALAVGGDFNAPTTAPDGAARSVDGGRTWTVAEGVPGEYREGVAWTKTPGVAITVGPTGSDITYDGGRTWHRFETGGNLHAVQCAQDGACWASGARGRVARLILA
jgi:photosystem II stability/assembly factor-like uncharacterized protein